MTLCSWPSLCKGSKCLNCGYILKHDYGKPPIRECDGGPCRHLGDGTGDVALIECTSCKGRVRIKYPLHVCAAFDECLPTLSGTAEGYHACRGCAEFAPAHEEI
jgi:hypothetical protein